MTQRTFTRFCTLSIIAVIISALNATCQAEKTVMGYVTNTTHDVVYSLFNVIFSSNGVWLLLGLAAFVAYLFWRKS